jgi:hypothetical protein
MVSIITPLRIDWWLAINGLIISWLHMAIILLVSGSMGYVLSSVFRDNAMGKGILGIAGIEIVIRSLNAIYNAGFPSLLENLVKLVMSGFNNFEKAVAMMKYGGISFSDTTVVNACGPNGPASIASQFKLPVDFLGTLWATLFTWDIGFKLLFCIVMYILATCIYHRREVQF